jgi:hypothetical protein
MIGNAVMEQLKKLDKVISALLPSIAVLKISKSSAKICTPGD